MTSQAAPILFPMGGELSPKGACLQRFCKLAGGSHAKIVILPTASEVAEGGSEYLEIFASFGCKDTTMLPLRHREQRVTSNMLQALASATAIFISGGNQLKLMSQLALTPIPEALRIANKRGALLAGTSAGASAMSSYMIADGASGLMPQYGMVQLSAGLELLPYGIIDQHFGARNRLGRLLVAVSLNPQLLGIGIDEDTGLEIYPDGSMYVRGSGSVIIVDARNSQQNTVHSLQPQQPLALTNLTTHILTEHWQYNGSTNSTLYMNKELQ